MIDIEYIRGTGVNPPIANFVRGKFAKKANGRVSRRNVGLGEWGGIDGDEEPDEEERYGLVARAAARRMSGRA